jgi:hypothetical protein
VTTKTLQEKILDLAERLEGDDKALLFFAACQLAPGPEPTIESTSQPIPGFYVTYRYYGSLIR